MRILAFVVVYCISMWTLSFPVSVFGWARGDWSQMQHWTALWWNTNFQYLRDQSNARIFSKDVDAWAALSELTPWGIVDQRKLMQDIHGAIDHGIDESVPQYATVELFKAAFVRKERPKATCGAMVHIQHLINLHKNIPARMLGVYSLDVMSGHVMLEVLEGGKWILYDPYFNTQVYVDGEPAGILDAVRAAPSRLTFDDGAPNEFLRSLLVSVRFLTKSHRADPRHRLNDTVLLYNGLKITPAQADSILAAVKIEQAIDIR